MTVIWTNLVDFESPMLYMVPRFCLKAFLVLEKKIFKCFLSYRAMAAILFNGTEPFEQIVSILSTECPVWNLVNIAQAVSEKKYLKITQFHICIIYPRGKAANPKGTKFLLLLKSFTTLIIHCKFQPLVFNTFWENDFSTFSPYKCIVMQIWSCCKKVKGQPTTIIWTNLVDLESLMLYTKIQPQSFLGFGEEDF